MDIKPSFVQARFHPETHFELPLRKSCREKGIAFQAHKVLKGNREGLVRDELIVDLANILGVTNEVSQVLEDSFSIYDGFRCLKPLLFIASKLSRQSNLLR